MRIVLGTQFAWRGSRVLGEWNLLKGTVEHSPPVYRRVDSTFEKLCMPVCRISSILDCLCRIYQQAALSFQEMALTASNEAIRRLATEMEQRERWCARWLAEIPNNGGVREASIWMNSIPRGLLGADAPRIRVSAPHSLEQLIEEIIAFNASLIGTYQVIARHTDFPEVREVFVILAALEAIENRRCARLMLRREHCLAADARQAS